LQFAGAIECSSGAQSSCYVTAARRLQEIGGSIPGCTGFVARDHEVPRSCTPSG
jgi:hypothetical protein